MISVMSEKEELVEGEERREKITGDGGEGATGEGVNEEGTTGDGGGGEDATDGVTGDGGEGVTGDGGEGVTCDNREGATGDGGVTGDDESPTAIRNPSPDKPSEVVHPSSMFSVTPQKRNSQYQLVFTGDSVNHKSKAHSDLSEVEEIGSTVSSSTLVPTEGDISSDTIVTLQEQPRVTEGRGEENGRGGGVAGGEVGLQGGEVDRGVSPSDVMIQRADSVTPPPKPKEHALSRLTSDSDAADSPPYSPAEYHSSEDDTGGTPTLPIMTPSPLPSGADSPLGDNPPMSILFSGVFYLGSSTVDAPISETEANRKMNILHEQALTSQPMPIILSVPVTNDGSVLLKDPKTDQPLTTFAVKMILFCARGNASLQDCFCLNVRHKRSGTYHCHVFRCEIMEAVSHIACCSLSRGHMPVYHVNVMYV